jgi:predicted ABC-type exoprotein transport system permease subunit
MENLLKKSKLLSGVIFTFSLMVCMLIALPILVELDSTFASITLLAVTCFGIIALDITIKKKVSEFILSEIERNKNKHIHEFFTYIESDKQFTKNVLRRDIPILNDDNEEVGEQTVYTALVEKKYKFMR